MQFKAIVAFAVALIAPVLAANELQLVSYVPFANEGGLTTVPGAANGAYTSHNSTHLAYYGMLSTEAPSVKARNYFEERQLTCDVSCNSQTASASDIQGANNGMANLLAGKPSFSGSVSFRFNNVWAFGCDYGNGQTESGSQWNFDVGCVNAQCTNSQGGWNSHHTWKSSYGREIGGFSC